MLTFCWAFALSFSLLCTELLLAKGQLLFPAGLFLCFYLGTSHSIRLGMVAGILTSMSAEVVLARSSTNLPIFILMAALLAVFSKFGDRLSTFNHAVAGAILTVINACYYLFIENFYFRQGWSLLSWPRISSILLTSVLTGLVIFPFLIAILDRVAEFAGMKRFRIQAGGLR